MSANDSSVIIAIKAWALPAVFAFAVGMLNTSLQEMKHDIKTLLAQSERDKVKIDYLEKEVQVLRTKVAAVSQNENHDHEDTLLFSQFFAIIPKKLFDSDSVVTPSV